MPSPILHHHLTITTCHHLHYLTTTTTCNHHYQMPNRRLTTKSKSTKDLTKSTRWGRKPPSFINKWTKS
jgi:hypothetical protein